MFRHVTRSGILETLILETGTAVAEIFTYRSIFEHVPRLFSGYSRSTHLCKITACFSGCSRHNKIFPALATIALYLPIRASLEQQG